MCISNIGNRRPFPTNGFKSRGAVPASATSSSIATAALKNALNASNTAKHHPHIIVQHNYHDHANDSRVDYQEDHPAKGGVTEPFPLKLHRVLKQVEADSNSHIVSFQPHGRCFVVHDPKKFTELLPHYFKLSKLASFQRQLNLYGFQRITRGRDRGGYYHELFLKNRVFLAHSIQRVKVKGTGVRARSNPEQEPNLWDMPWVEAQPNNVSGSETSSTRSASPVPSSPLHQQESDEEVFDNTGLPASFFTQKFPLHLEPTALPSEDEVLFGKHFFSTDNDSSMVKQEPASAQLSLQDEELLAEEVDAFFEDFDFPDDIGNEIEDDAVFGDLLTQMIS